MPSVVHIYGYIVRPWQMVRWVFVIVRSLHSPIASFFLNFSWSPTFLRRKAFLWLSVLILISIMLGCGTASSLLRLNPEKVTFENLLLKHEELKTQRSGDLNSTRRRSIQFGGRNSSPGPPTQLASLAELYFQPPISSTGSSRNGSVLVPNHRFVNVQSISS